MKNIMNSTVTSIRKLDNSCIEPSFKISTEEEALDLIDKTKPGDYISIANKNNLSEVFIYQRNDNIASVPDSAKWDGASYDTDWFNYKDDKFVITTAAQLKGFQLLVNSGVTFKGKEVMLGNSIDLCKYDWIPIGLEYQTETYNIDNDIRAKYVLNLDHKHTFQGVFNGCGHRIMRLHLPEGGKRSGFYGFFTSISEAEINNVIFDYVDLCSEDDSRSYCAVAGIANNSIFTNVIVTGNIISPKPSGICGIAIDSAFYSCKNLAVLYAKVKSDTGIVAGGICQQLTITKKMIEYLDNKAPKLFVNCVNEGAIIADGKYAKYLWIGHFFGGTYYEKDVTNFNFIIETCTIRKNAYISVLNSKDIKGEKVFFGCSDYEKQPTNNVGEHSKDDLLDGIIGRVDQGVGIKVRKSTSSVIINNLVIPGTINTLASDPGKNTFYTMSASSIGLEEKVYNFEPYFKYVKTTKK